MPGPVMPVLLIRDGRKQLGLRVVGGHENLRGKETQEAPLSSSFLLWQVFLQPEVFPPTSASLPSLYRLLPHSSLSFLVTYF